MIGTGKISGFRFRGRRLVDFNADTHGSSIATAREILRDYLAINTIHTHYQLIFWLSFSILFYLQF
jgi:hypothetical protein